MNLGDDTKTIFSSPQSLESNERDAVEKGEARGKREYMKDNPKCGLKRNSRLFQRNYDLIDWKK